MNGPREPAGAGGVPGSAPGPLAERASGLPIRIIPRLDVKGPNLVKGIQLEGLRVLGPPEAFARLYYESGADELLYMDVVASLYERNSLTEIVERTSRDIFIPLTVGGGLRTLDDVHTALAAGADKVAINTAAIRRARFITEAADRFGSSAIVVSIEAKRQPEGTWQAYTDNGRIPSGRDVVAWAREAVELGAGELLVTSVDREGTGNGFDLDLVRAVAGSVGVPVVACGGAGRIEHAAAAVTIGHADAVALASLLHYGAAGQLAADGAARPAARFSRIAPCSLPQLKHELTEMGIDCRYDGSDAQFRHDAAPARGHR